MPGAHATEFFQAFMTEKSVYNDAGIVYECGEIYVKIFIGHTTCSLSTINPQNKNEQNLRNHITLSREKREQVELFTYQY